MSGVPGKVRIVEVGPRDGLQNEKAIVPTPVKIELIDRLSDTGLQTIEATSFVSPKWVPQLADATDVYTAIRKKHGVRYPVLVPNLQGYERARAVGVDEIAVFTAASEAFNRKNINASIDESIERFTPVMERAKADGVAVRGYVSTVLGCPYQGDVPVADVVRVAKRLHDLGCYEISLGDTIGIGTPAKAKAMLAAVAARGADRRARGAFPRHARPGAGEYPGMPRTRRVGDRLGRFRHRRLSLRERRERQCRQRRCRLHAARHGHRDRHRSRSPDRNRPLAQRATSARQRQQSRESRGVTLAAARAAFARGAFDDTLSLATRALASAPEEARLLRINAALKLERWHIAVDDLQWLLDKRGANSKLSQTLSECWVRIGNANKSAKPEEALLAYRKAMDANPSNSSARFNMAVVLASLGRPREAIDAARFSCR